MSYYGWKPYVPVARRRAQAARYIANLAKREKRTLSPIEIEGRHIACSVWGQAWCDNLERYSDFENRLPRGRTYVRNGSVIDLQIDRGRVLAIVSGSEIYRVGIMIKTLRPAAWKSICRDCSASIHSVLDLLQGRFDQGVMQRLARTDGGLFPQPSEIKMDCSCPDWAGMCKHVAAVLYGVGARLDRSPELLFTLRNVDHQQLISQVVAAENLEQSLAGSPSEELAKSDLNVIFGIELDAAASPPKPATRGQHKTGVSPAGRPRADAARASKARSARIKPNRIKATRNKSQPSHTAAVAVSSGRPHSTSNKLRRKAAR